MAFGKLREYNTRNIFFQKPYTKCNVETLFRPVSKRSKSKLSICLDQ